MKTIENYIKFVRKHYPIDAKEGRVSSKDMSDKDLRIAIDKIAFWTDTPTTNELFWIHVYFWFLQAECEIEIDTNV